MTDELKEKLKKRLKVVTISSPALAALLMFPTESLAFLKMLKEAGFEAGTIATIATIAWLLRKDVVRIVDGRLGELNTNVKQVSEDLKVSNEQNAKQFTEGAKIMQVQSQQIRFIMTHLQLSIPEEKPKDQDLTP